MDVYTEETQKNLEDRFEMTVDGVYYAHQPIYGYRSPYCSTSCIGRYMITKSILNALTKYSFSNFIDIGGAEGYTANLVKQLFHVPVKSTDLSANACRRATEIFGIPAIPCDIHSLPFESNEFDAVLCSETIEHVTDYKKAIEELLRITKNILIITVPHETREMVAANIRNKVPHGHIHYFQTDTLDYLKELGYTVKYEKTLSPLLVIPRVVSEGFKKEGNKLHFKLYNSLTPLFRKLFGIKTANSLTNLDVKLTKNMGLYGGITFMIEKTPVLRVNGRQIKAADFTDIKVKLHKMPVAE